MDRLILGLVTGVIFGFLLQKGRVLRYEKQLGAMLLKDMTILKFMLSAILVGTIGLHLLVETGTIAAFSHKPMNMGAVIIGGILFGIGWAIMGYCPGTSMGAIGEGRWHAVFAVIGMVIGAAVFAELYPWLSRTVMAWKDFGNLGVPEMLGLNPWVVVVVFWCLVLGVFVFFEKKNL